MSTLIELHNEIKTCQKCQLVKGATRAVPGEGPADAKIMFIGEAPGFNEDQQGRPFVGAAGQFLDQLIASIGLRRDQVYITNVVKHRPPDNRDPLPGEIEACRPWLDRQIEMIRPRMIVTLGRYSMARAFPADKTISKVHGTTVKKDGVLYFAMYHPAAALHQGNLRATLEADMRKIPPLIEELEKAVAAKEKPVPAKQLNLFQG